MDRRFVLGLSAILAFSLPETGLGQSCGFDGTLYCDGPEALQMDEPGGFCSGAGGFIVADTGNDRLVSIVNDVNCSQAEWVAWGSSGSGSGEFLEPNDVVSGPDGSFYVADTGNDRIQVLGPGGAFLREWGTSGTEPGNFDRPLYLWVGADDVFVTDSGNRRVQRFSTQGDFKLAFGAPGSGAGMFEEPTGIWSPGAESEEVFVADASLDRIQVFDWEGNYLRTIGTSGSMPGQLRRPMALSDDHGYFLVADFGNARIQSFSLEGGGCPLDIVYEGAFTDAIGAACCNVMFALDGVGGKVLAFGSPDPVTPTSWGNIKSLYRDGE